MSEKEYIESQKDCARLLGLTFEEYMESLENIKCPKFENDNSNEEHKNLDLKPQKES